MSTALRPLGRSSWLPATVALSLFFAACGVQTWSPTLHPAGAPVPIDTGDDSFLKVHMQSGELYVLESWSVPDAGEDLVGSGVHFDLERVEQATGSHRIPAAEIALLETNRREVVSRFAYSGLVVFSTLSAVTMAICLADPKSCFGSCPTFYSVDDPDRPLAEGFSSSFARSLEERDVDRLGLRATSGPFSLVMRNEAQETHAVRHVKLLVAAAPERGEVLLTSDGDLVATTDARSPSRCVAGDGDCLAEVSNRDDVEYAPTTDETDLGVREEIVVDFGSVQGEVGLILSARNSFVTTYVFYQSLAYAGRRTGDLLAALERGEPGAEDRVLGLSRELGGIEVLISDDGGGWAPAGEFSEAGPIAADQQVIRLGRVDSDDLRVMLRMAQGSWRIDEIRLAHVGSRVAAVSLEPDSVTSREGTDPRAMERLTGRDEHLVTVPGDAYRIWFTIPEGDEYQLFLDSRGFYYEWVREGWLEDESALLAASVLLQPREALRMMAPGFKEVEPEMERLFWSSRFRR